MKVKTAELTGIALDWAVAKCDGFIDHLAYRPAQFVHTHRLGYDNYSTDWLKGGPLLESEKISVEIKPHGYWMASHQYNYTDEKRFLTLGDTLLMAAMRCFVASKLGEEVEIPEKLK